jgi:Tfp pilus assembly protein PilX
MFKGNEKGIALFMVVVITAVSLGIVAGMSSLLFKEMKITQRIGHSVLSFHAADSGIERTIYATRKESYDPSTCTPTPCLAYPIVGDPSLNNGSSYQVYVQSIDTSTQLRSVGSYVDTQRGVEISY